MKKLIALTMTLTFLLSCICSSYAFAAQPEETEPYASSYFATYAVELSDAGSCRSAVSLGNFGYLSHSFLTVL